MSNKKIREWDRPIKVQVHDLEIDIIPQKLDGKIKIDLIIIKGRGQEELLEFTRITKDE
jgi:hypothetical protein